MNTTIELQKALLSLRNHNQKFALGVGRAPAINTAIMNMLSAGWIHLLDADCEIDEVPPGVRVDVFIVTPEGQRQIPEDAYNGANGAYDSLFARYCMGNPGEKQSEHRP